MGDRRSLTRRFAKGFGLSLLALFLFFAVLEGGARLVYGKPMQGTRDFFVPHPTRVYMRTPNYEGFGRYQSGPNQFIDIPFRTSSLGLRGDGYGPKEPGEFRILILGDSNTECLTMPDDATIPRMIEQDLAQKLPGRRITVINAGVSGYGPWQERDLLNEIGFSFQPDLVLAQILPANDIDNELNKVDKCLESYPVKFRRYFNEFRHMNKWPVWLHRWTRLHSQVYKLAYEASGSKPLIVNLVNSFHIRHYDFPTPPPGADRPDIIEVELQDYYPLMREGWSMLLDDLKGMQQECKAKGVDFIAYGMTVVQTVSEEVFQGTAAQGNGAKYERGKGMRLLDELCRQNAVPYIDLMPNMTKDPDPKGLFLQYDGHHSEKGARMVADTIADYLAQNYFPTKR